MDKFDEKVIGYESTKEILRQILDILKRPEVYKRKGISIPRGLLMESDPGLGKSLLASILMEESERKPFVFRKTSQENSFLDELRAVFAMAKEDAPSILLLEDLNLYVESTSPYAPEWACLQACIDDAKDTDLFVIATTNDTRYMPPSLLRPGRFDYVIYLQPPIGENAENIVSYYLRDKDLAEDVLISDIVKAMDDDTVAVDYDELKLSGYTVMTLPDEDRMSGNVCELGTYRFGYSGDCDFLRHLKFWSATKKVKKLLAELPENETWDIPAMENNETIIKLLRVLVDNFNIELYKNLYTREIENNTENGRCMFMSHDIKCSQADYFTEPEISRLLKILSPLDKSTLEELLIDPKERAAKRAKTAAERKEFMDFWSAESLEKHLQNPDVNISALAKIECYLYKALDDRMGDISECQNYYSLYTEAERDVAQKKVNFICTWIKEHPLDFDWTDEMEEANQQVQYQIYANKMLSYLKKNASAKEQFDTAVRFAIQYDVVDENNNVVTSYEPKIKFTMSLLANLELKIIFGTVPDALECHSYEEAVEHRNQFYEIVKKYSLGEVTGNQCVLNKMYDDMFAQKGSYAFYIQWLNNEFPSEVEYQKKLQETKGLKKILVMATKPNHLATIE